MRRLAGQQADRRYGEHDQPERREHQRGVQQPPEVCGNEELQARESHDHGEARECHPEPGGQHRGAFRLIRLPDRGTALEGEVVCLREQLQLHQVGCLAVHSDDIARRRAGWVIRLLVEDHRLAGEPLILPEPVQDRAHCCLVGGVASGEFRGLHRGAVGRGAVGGVAIERLLGAAALAVLAAGEQDAGHLGVHIAKSEVQIAGGENLWASVVPDDAQPVPCVSNGDVGDDIEPGDREHGDGGECADAPWCGPQPQSAEAGGGPPPVRSLGPGRGVSRGEHA